MEPLPQTRQAIEELGPFVDEDLIDVMVHTADRVRAVVPSLIGLSLGLLSEGLTFTVQATAAEIAGLDAVQYLDGGPCVDVLDTDPGNDRDDAEHTDPGTAGSHASDVHLDDRALTFTAGDVLAEERWHLFARATAAAGVGSTLTLPVVRHGRVVGSVNLYAGESDAFEGVHDVVALHCRAWAPGAVTNADLSFATRLAASRAPQVLHEQMVVSQAVGVLVSRRGIDIAEARAAIRDVAVQAGVSEYEVAIPIVDSIRGKDE